MDAKDLYVTLTTIQGELQSTVGELFAMFCVEHKDAASKNARQALSNVLKKSKELNSLETLHHGFVKNRVYDTNEDGSMFLRGEINIKLLDCLFIFDVLKNVKGFPTYQEKLQRRKRLQSCKQVLHQQCCLACNHKCVKCEKKECKGPESCHPGEKCNQHPCRNCDERKEVCLHSSTVCCKKCDTCFYCGSKLTLEASERCERLRLICGLETLTKFRDSLETMTFEDCRLFLEGTATLPGLPLCRTLKDLCKYVLEAYSEILLYISDPHNFIKQPALSKKDLEAKKSSLTSIFEQTDADWLLFTSQEEVVKTLGFINETKTTPSTEYTSIIQKIEEVNQEERFQRKRTEVLVDRSNSVKNGEVSWPERDKSCTNNNDNENGDKENNSSHEQSLHDTTVSVPLETQPNEHVETTTTKNIDTVDKVRKMNSPSDEKTSPAGEKEEPECTQESLGDGEQPSLMREVVQEIRDCVEEIKSNNESFEREVRENFNTLRCESNNEKVLTQLSVVMEKLTQIELETRQANEERRQEMEEVKRNQKNVMEFMKEQQKAKGLNFFL